MGTTKWSNCKIQGPTSKTTARQYHPGQTEREPSRFQTLPRKSSWKFSARKIPAACTRSGRQSARPTIACCQVSTSRVRLKVKMLTSWLLFVHKRCFLSRKTNKERKSTSKMSTLAPCAESALGLISSTHSSSWARKRRSTSSRSSQWV